MSLTTVLGEPVEEETAFQIWDQLSINPLEFAVVTQRFIGNAAEINGRIAAKEIVGAFSSDVHTVQDDTQALRAAVRIRNDRGNILAGIRLTIRLYRENLLWDEQETMTDETGLVECIFTGLANGEYEIRLLMGGASEELSLDHPTVGVNGNVIRASFQSTTIRFNEAKSASIIVDQLSADYLNSPLLIEQLTGAISSHGMESATLEIADENSFEAVRSNGNHLQRVALLQNESISFETLFESLHSLSTTFANEDLSDNVTQYFVNGLTFANGTDFKSVGKSYVVVTIDMTDTDWEYTLPSLITVDGQGITSVMKDTPLLIFNPVIRNDEGYTPFSGKLRLGGGYGVLLAPDAEINGSDLAYVGTVIARETLHDTSVWQSFTDSTEEEYALIDTIEEDRVTTVDTAKLYTVQATISEGSATVPISAVASVNGNVPSEEEIFTYELLDHSGNVLQTAQNQGELIAFESISYTVPGSYQYSIRQTATDRPGYRADLDTHGFVITIPQEMVDGEYIPVITRSEDSSLLSMPEGIAFRTTYSAAATLEIPVQVLVNEQMPAADQSFVVQSNEGHLAQTNQNGIAVLQIPLTLKDIGIQKYQLKLQESEAAGVQIDSSILYVQAQVTDNGNGTLHLDYTIEDQDGTPIEAVFRNTWYGRYTFRCEEENQDPTVSFSYTVQLRKSGQMIRDQFPYLLNGQDGFVLEAGQALTLHHGDEVTLYPLPADSSVTITQQADALYRTVVNSEEGQQVASPVTGQQTTAVFLNEIKRIHITVHAIWAGSPSKVSLVLLADGIAADPQPRSVKVLNQYTWSNLPVADENGKLIDYSVAVENVPDHYLVSYRASEDEPAILTAAPNDGQIIFTQQGSITVTIRWRDMTQNTVKPSVELELYRNGQLMPSFVAEQTAEDTYSFSDLPLADEETGYVYSVRQKPLPGYSTMYINQGDYTNSREAYDGGTIVNMLESSTTGSGSSSLILYGIAGAIIVLLLLWGILALRRRNA